MSDVKGTTPAQAMPPAPAAEQPVRAAPPPAALPPPAPAVLPSPAPAMPPPAMRRGEAAAEGMLAFGRSALADVAETQAAWARGFEAMALEMTGLARSGIAAASDGATALLNAKTPAEAVEAQIGLARRGIDAVVGGSLKLVEIGVRSANEASRPLLSRIADPAKAFPA